MREGPRPVLSRTGGEIEGDRGLMNSLELGLEHVIRDLDAESLVGLGLCHSKARKFAHPPQPLESYL